MLHQARDQQFGPGRAVLGDVQLLERVLRAACTGCSQQLMVITREWRPLATCIPSSGAASSRRPALALPRRAASLYAQVAEIIARGYANFCWPRTAKVFT